MSEGENSETDAIAVTLHFEDPENVPILYASNIFIRFEPHLFNVVFAQATGPLEVTPNREELERSGVTARVVAKLAIPPDHWKRMIDAFTENYARWEELTLAGAFADPSSPTEPPSTPMATVQATPTDRQDTRGNDSRKRGNDSRKEGSDTDVGVAKDPQGTNG